jgi:hypothetical protein
MTKSGIKEAGDKDSGVGSELSVEIFASTCSPVSSPLEIEDWKLRNEFKPAKVSRNKSDGNKQKLNHFF